MILVTLGTHPQPMDRLIEALDRLIESGDISEPVIIQSAAYHRRPVHAEAHQLVPYDQLDAWAKEASAIVTHGGPGSIMLALGAGHSPVVVPRDPALGEHVDGHQLHFAAWLAGRRPVHVVTSMSDLGPAIEQARAEGREGAAAGYAPQVAIDRLTRIVEGR